MGAPTSNIETPLQTAICNYELNCGGLEVQLGGEVAVDVEADGFFHELLRDTEAFRQLPELAK